MPRLAVEISRFVDEDFPGFVECTLMDAEGVRHVIHEKAPLLTCENLQPTSVYPSPGEVACEVLAEWKNPNGRSLLRVSTAKPFHIESTVGQTEFLVFASQVLR